MDHLLPDAYAELLRYVQYGEERIDPMTGEVIPEDEFSARLAAVNADIDALAGLARALEADASLIQSEERRLYALRARRVAALDAVRERIRSVVEAAGGKVKTGKTLAYLGAASVSVVVDDESVIPEVFKRPAPPDTAAIKAALKEGVNIPGARLVTGRKALYVR